MILSSNCISGIYPRKMKTYVQWRLCWILIAPNWKKSRCPSRRVVKQIVLSYHEVETWDNLSESLRSYAEWKNTVQNVYIMCDSIYIMFLNDKIIQMENIQMIVKRIVGSEGEREVTVAAIGSMRFLWFWTVLVPLPCHFNFLIEIL